MAQRWNGKLTPTQQFMVAVSKCNRAWFQEKLTAAVESQLRRPAHDGVRRFTPPQSLELLYEFVIPDYFAPTGNVQTRISSQVYARLKESCEKAYMLQCGFVPAPLDGRPVVLVTRFSTVEPDPVSDWPKIPLDSLLTRKVTQTKRGTRVRSGIGVLKDDSNRAIELYHWWEPGPKNDGFIWLRVYSQ